MVSASSNQQDFYFIKEVTEGTAPTGTYTRMRFTSESLAHSQQSTSSNEIRSDRQTADLIRTSISAGGSIPFEFSYGSFDALWPGAFASADWVTAGLGNLASQTDITFTARSGSTPANIADGAGTGFATNFAVGNWVRVSGSASNDGVYRIIAINNSGADIDVDGDTVTAEAAGASVTITEGEYITTGSTKSSYAFEKTWTDLTPQLFEGFTGNVLEGFSLDIGPNQILTGAFNLTGRKSLGLSANSITSGTSTEDVADPATSGDVMNAIDHATAYLEDSDGLSIKSSIITGLSTQLANNTRATEVVGTLGARTVSLGALNLTGSLTTLLEGDDGVYGDLINFTDSSLSLGFKDTAGNRYVLWMPRIKYSDGSIQNQGLNTDIPLELSYTAIRDATYTYTARMFRWAA